VISTVVGILLLLALLRDVVSELFDPGTSGRLSRAVMQGAWRGVRAVARRHHGAIHHAGAVVLLAVAFAWVSLLMLGFALVYWPRLPDDFQLGPGLPPEAGQGFATALYISLASATTLNTSELVPATSAMRMAVAVESMLGVGLITAWITWVLSIYPVLADRRAFERQVALIRRTHPQPAAVMQEVPREAVTGMLRSLTEQLLRIGSSLGQTRVTYYFQNESRDLALAKQLPYVLALAHAAESDGREDAVRYHGATLRLAAESVLGQVGERFLGLPDAAPDVVLDALAADHLLENPAPTRGHRAQGATNSRDRGAAS
jgi:hypothetical protein